ncbi:ABC transporter substrate-binding protein [Rhodoligotrophos ferricapiens]|uniref:ABC transporter substrate-binding protein n=1 Tax=Rhodoligotrophos ferricapiens TaxID=3069264 RepID=UPI00315DFA9B
MNLKRILLAAVLATAPSAVIADDFGVTETAIRIAVQDSLSGAYSQYGVPSLNGVRYVFDKVNAEGGINGRKIEVVAEDDGCSPKQSVGVATKLASERSVLAVMGLTCSAAAIAVRDTVAPTTPMPFISFSSGGYTSSSPDLGGLKENFFFITPSVHTQGGALVNFVMNTLKPQRVAFIGQTDVYGKEGRQGVEAMLAEYGQKIIADDTMEPRGTDATAQVLKLKAANPDVVIAFLYQVPAQILLRQANELGLKATIVTSASVTDSSIYKSLPPAALENYYGSMMAKDVLDSARMKPIMDDLRARYPDVTFNPLVVSGIGAAELMVEALRSLGKDVTPEKLAKAIDQSKDVKTSALSYPVTFTPENHMGGRGLGIYEIKDNAEVLAMPGYWPGTEKASEPVVAN